MAENLILVCNSGLLGALPREQLESQIAIVL